MHPEVDISSAAEVPVLNLQKLLDAALLVVTPRRRGQRGYPTSTCLNHLHVTIYSSSLFTVDTKFCSFKYAVAPLLD